MTHKATHLEEESQEQGMELKTHLLPLVGVTENTKLTAIHIYPEDQAQTLAVPVLATSVPLSPYSPCSDDSWAMTYAVLHHHWLLSSYFSLFHCGFSELWGEGNDRILQFIFFLLRGSSCMSQHLFPSTAWGNLSDDSWTKHWFMGTFQKELLWLEVIDNSILKANSIIV